ncbi:MAG: hypothetical protein JXX29_23160 [Deltaproteobacteria bacterium]|nr:hypothetical protein [Deltaproteobacteria bacterium]MBN2674600.1 hypothetical protein [Deltaproteobacteria bacterium]
MEVLLDNKVAILKVYPEKKIVHHEIKGFIQGDNFKKLLTTGSDAFKKHHCTKWLSDDRKSSALRKEDLDWGHENWEPGIMKAGWKHWALVLPEQIFGQMNMKELIKRYGEQGVSVQVFTDPDEAMTWLEAQ